MAEREKEKKSEHKAGKKEGKKHLRAITTHKADDGSFVHEHHYTNHKGEALPASFGGVSTDMDDLKQHMEDHMSPEADQGGEDEQADEGAEPQPGAAPGPQQAA